MARGILELLGLAATVTVALPLALLGVEFLVFGGRPVTGVAFLAIAAGMVALRSYVTTPGDVPGMVVEKTVGAVARTDSDQSEDGS